MHGVGKLRGRFTVGHKNLIAVIAEARKEVGISQRELSIALGRATNFIHFVEVGQQIPNVLEFIAIANELGVPPLVLMDRVLRGTKATR